MNKQTFIQNAVIEWMPEMKWKIDLVIASAEKAWKVMHENGYGSEGKQGPRVGKDYYSMLTKDQRLQFDGFWAAFAYKHGKQGAAKRWAEIGSFDDAEYKRMIFSAKKEAETRGSRGTTPPMAALWLAERRWQDTVIETSIDNSHEIKLRELHSSLAHAKNMLNIDQSETWRVEIEKISIEIEEITKAQ